MNRRRITQLAVALLLLFVLTFWGCARIANYKTPVKRTGPRANNKLDPTPLPKNQAGLERPTRKLISPTEQDKVIIFPVQHSSIIRNDSYVVFGEVENRGKVTGHNIITRVVFKDPSWFTRLAVVETPIDRPTLEPGQKSTFSATLKGVPPTRVGSYVLMTVSDPPVPPSAQDTTTTGLIGYATDLGETVRDRLGISSGRDGRTGDSNGDEPDWLLLLLILTSGGYGGWRFLQWRQR